METLVVHSEETIRSKVREFVVTNFLFGSHVEFEETDSFIQKGILDSTGILELIEYIESTFNIHVEEFETVPENLDSLLNVGRFIRRKLNIN